MPVTSFAELPEPTRAAAQAYLDQVEAAVRPLDAAAAADIVGDLQADLADALSPVSTPADVALSIESLGTPAGFAAEVAASAPKTARTDSTEPAGRLLGIPYDYRPTPDRIASRWWNPRDSRIFMPRVFGIGWDLNFGAIAVRLHLIEPDAEDEPFGAVSDLAFLVALLVPVGLTALMLGTYLGLRASLPPMLPTHWNARGVPDGFWPQGAAFGFLLTMAALPTLWAVWAVAARYKPLSRGAVIGLASFAASLSAGLWLLTLATVFASPISPALPALAILPCILVPLAVFLGLARAGRAAEMRRDLGPSSNGR